MTMEVVGQLCDYSLEQLEEFYYNTSVSINGSSNVSSSNGTVTESLAQFLEDTESLCETKFLNRMISIIVPIIFAIIALVGIIGNILVLIVVALKQQMRNTTNVLIVVSLIFKFLKT